MRPSLLEDKDENLRHLEAFAANGTCDFHCRYVCSFALQEDRFTIIKEKTVSKKKRTLSASVNSGRAQCGAF